MKLEGFDEVKPTLISTDNPQSRVPVLQGFWKKYYPNAVRRGDFFQNLYNLAGLTDTGLPLSVEIGVGWDWLIMVLRVIGT